MCTRLFFVMFVPVELCFFSHELLLCIERAYARFVRFGSFFFSGGGRGVREGLINEVGMCHSRVKIYLLIRLFLSDGF